MKQPKPLGRYRGRLPRKMKKIARTRNYWADRKTWSVPNIRIDVLLEHLLTNTIVGYEFDGEPFFGKAE
jgi:hypothetical protein